MENNSETDFKQEKQTKSTKKTILVFDQKPTPAFIGASWISLLVGITSYCVGLWNSDMQLNERGYYFTILLFG